MEEAIEFQIKSVELSSQVELPYAEQGGSAGIPVIFLHGFLDSWHSFARVLACLPESIHALAVTQRGHGAASRPPTGYSIVDFATDLEAFMDGLELETAVVVGHSMGSAVALRFAIDHPERVAGLVLIGASPTMESTPSAQSYWNSTLAALTDPVASALVRQTMTSALVQPVPEEFLNVAVQKGLEVPSFVWKAVFNSRWRQEGDFSGELGQILAPALIVWGDGDARYSRREQEVLAGAIRNAKLVIYPGAGHMLHWEQPHRFSADLITFIEKLTS